VRHPAVRLGVLDGGDERGLAVVAFDPPDAGARRDPAAATVAADDEPTGQPLAAVERHSGGRRIGRLPDHPRPCAQGRERARVDRVEQGPAQEAVLEEMPHRALIDLAVVEMQEERRRALAGAAVAHLDVEDRLGLAGDRAP
jgi:hypothetical protein